VQQTTRLPTRKAASVDLDPSLDHHKPLYSEIKQHGEDHYKKCDQQPVTLAEQFELKHLVPAF
jgi:hypothetical protein